MLLPKWRKWQEVSCGRTKLCRALHPNLTKECRQKKAFTLSAKSFVHVTRMTVVCSVPSYNLNSSGPDHSMSPPLGFSKLCLCDRILCWSIIKKSLTMKAPGSQLPPPTLLFDLTEGLTEQKHCFSHEAPGGSCFTRAMKGTTVNNGGLFDPTFVCNETPASTLL